MKLHLLGKKSDQLNKDLVNEYLDNMEKNSKNAIKLCNKGNGTKLI